MNAFGDYDPALPSLELSQEELAGIFHALAEGLILSGERVVYEGLYPVESEGHVPLAFRRVLPSSFVKEVYYQSDSEIIAQAGDVTYIGPHCIEPNDEEVFEELTVYYPGLLLECGVQYNQWIHITRRGEEYTAVSDAQYVKDGKVISPNNLPVGGGEPELTDEYARQILDDRTALERPIELDDVEKLRQLIDFIKPVERLE